MRPMFRLDEAERLGRTRAEVRWGADHGRWTWICRGVYGDGPDDPSDQDRAVARVVATDGAATGLFAAALLGMDGCDEYDWSDPTIAVDPGRSAKREGVQRRRLRPDQLVTIGRIGVTSPFQTLLDLAPLVDDLVWEQALEWVLRRRHATIADIEAAAAGLPGADRIRRVLALRPPGARPTGSMLETLMVQLIRAAGDLPTPQRQVEVRDEHDQFVARVDLAWPELGLFFELDGMGHKEQPLHDAARETSVVAATGWMCGRFTWREVRRTPQATTRKLRRLVAQAIARPVAGPGRVDAGRDPYEEQVG